MYREEKWEKRCCLSLEVEVSAEVGVTLIITSDLGEGDGRWVGDQLGLPSFQRALRMPCTFVQLCILVCCVRMQFLSLRTLQHLRGESHDPFRQPG